MSPDAVLLDVDGTLVDSGYLHAVAWWQALRQQQVDVPMSTIHRAIGMGGDQLIPHVLGGHRDDVDEEKLGDAHDAVYSTHWPALRRLPGARELVRRCHDCGMTTVLASSAGDDEVAVLREVLDADAWIDAATGSSDADRSKPAPDLLEMGLKRAGVAAGRAIYVGDAVWDVHAAVEAGMHCVGVECGGTSEAELRDAGASQVFRDPADLIERWSTSLLAG